MHRTIPFKYADVMKGCEESLLHRRKSKQQQPSAVEQPEVVKTADSMEAQKWISNSCVDSVSYLPKNSLLTPYCLCRKTELAAQDTLGAVEAKPIQSESAQRSSEASSGNSNVFMDYIHLWSGLGEMNLMVMWLRFNRQDIPT
jgi:hypothetical protein